MILARISLSRRWRVVSCAARPSAASSRSPGARAPWPPRPGRPRPPRRPLPPRRPPPPRGSLARELLRGAQVVQPLDDVRVGRRHRRVRLVEELRPSRASRASWATRRPPRRACWAACTAWVRAGGRGLRLRGGFTKPAGRSGWNPRRGCLSRRTTSPTTWRRTPPAARSSSSPWDARPPPRRSSSRRPGSSRRRFRGVCRGREDRRRVALRAGTRGSSRAPPPARLLFGARLGRRRRRARASPLRRDALVGARRAPRRVGDSFRIGGIPRATSPPPLGLSRSSRGPPPFSQPLRSPFADFLASSALGRARVLLAARRVRRVQPRARCDSRLGYGHFVQGHQHFQDQGRLVLRLGRLEPRLEDVEAVFGDELAKKRSFAPSAWLTRIRAPSPRCSSRSSLRLPVGDLVHQLHGRGPSSMASRFC